LRQSFFVQPPVVAQDDDDATVGKSPNDDGDDPWSSARPLDLLPDPSNPLKVIK